MPSKKLDLDLSEDEATDELRVNFDYAENYEKWRRMEELQKMKNKYGEVALDEESDADSESSEEPLTWTTQDDRDFFRTLGALKSKNPKIYDAKTHFFHYNDQSESSPTGGQPVSSKARKFPKTERMTLRNYEERLVTERDGRFSEDEDEDAAEEQERRSTNPSYDETQAKLKDELKHALNGFATENNEEEDELLKKRQKTETESHEEEADYVQWLKGKRNEGEEDEDLHRLKERWTSGQLDEGEKFLRDYLLNKRFDTDHTEVTTGLPTYDEIVREEEEEEKQTEFEVKYNFRFEEPDQDFIKQFPRTIKESVRLTETQRKEGRERRKARKDEQKKQRKEEIKQLKSMKRTEIEEKLRKLREITDDQTLPLSVDDLRGDFDPVEYDRRMKTIFTSEYYENVGDEEEKPVFSDLSDVEEAEVETEEDESSEQPQEATCSNANQTGRTRNHKRNSRFAEMIKRKKPVFDPNEKTFEEYLNEYYALDYEDIIADDLRTRFRYRRVEPNDFGLSTAEILDLDDAQLNAWVSVKKVTAYKSADEDRLDRLVYERKAQNPDRKRKVFSSITPRAKKRKPEVDAVSNGVETSIVAPTGKHKKRERKLPSAMDLGTDRLHAYGVSVPKLKSALHGRKRKKRGGQKSTSAQSES